MRNVRQQGARAGVHAALQRSLVLLKDNIRQRHHLELELQETRLELRCACTELADTRAREETARHTAFHDTLTGLPNRRFFAERSGRAVKAHEVQAREFGVVYIDLDEFKAINDVHGHAVGDELLKLIGARLKRSVRAEDSVYRHGGDEFLCLLQDVHSEAQVASVARKLFDAVSAPCQIGLLTLRVNASIGVALYPRDGMTVETLLERADSAMFWAKKHHLGHAFVSQIPARGS